MCDIRLFRSAYSEYKLAVSIFKLPDNDEMFLNSIAYHLQQSVKKVLKAFLECKGVTVPNTHDIYKLVRMSHDNGSNVCLTSWIDEKADTITRWEMDTRYNMDYYVEEEKIREGIKEIGAFFEMNGIKETLRTELSDETVKEKLRSFFPKNFQPASDFEWNCYYQIYRKKMEQTT